MTHKQDMDYYRQCKRTDPSFTVEVALKDYLSEYPDVAADIAKQVWEYVDDGKAMTRDEMWDYIRNLSPEDAFMLGQLSENVTDSSFIGVDGYLNFVNLTEREYQKRCRDVCRLAKKDIFNGWYTIPNELQEVIDLFADPDDGGYVANRKPVKKRTGKKTSKTKKASSTASKNRKPVSKKKAPAKTAKKKTGGRR